MTTAITTTTGRRRPLRTVHRFSHTVEGRTINYTIERVHLPAGLDPVRAIAPAVVILGPFFVFLAIMWSVAT